MNGKTSHNWKLKFRSFPHLDNLEVLHASNVTHNYPPHIHQEYSVAIVLRGVETVSCRYTSYTARAGEILIIPPEEVHSNTSLKSEYKAIKVPVATLRRIAAGFQDIGQKPISFSLGVRDELLFRSFKNLHRQLEQLATPLEQESAFAASITLLLKRQLGKTETPLSDIKKERRCVRQVREYLKSHYAENVTLSDLTAVTKLSPFYLLRAFHNSAGFPPHEYQTQLRIAHARKLIRDGVPLSQAALDTGFFDQSHLCRNFKRIVGVTPRQYFNNKDSLNQSNIVQ